MKIWNDEDCSLIEYNTESVNELDHINSKCPAVKEFTRFFNRNYETVALLEEKLTKHGHLNNQSCNIDGVSTNLMNQLEGFNMYSLFSLARVKDDAAATEKAQPSEK